MDAMTIVLQAGGESSRMGRDKALLPFMGKTMLGHILEQIRPLGDDIILINNNRPGYEHFGLPLASDLVPGWGPLGGLHTALSISSRELCLVLACDMPFVSLPVIKEMVRLSKGVDAVVPRLEKSGFTEPFRAVYRKTCLRPIADAIQAGRRRANSFFDRVNIRYFEQREIEKFDPSLRSFFNVNTPEDLVKAGKIAGK